VPAQRGPVLIDSDGFPARMPGAGKIGAGAASIASVGGSALRRVPKPPLEAGRPRVQRIVDELRPVHLELAPPQRDEWVLALEGDVTYECEVSLADLERIGPEEREIDFHCVWGWSRQRARWTGVPVQRLLDLAMPGSQARYAMLRAYDSPYASCVPLADLCAGFLAFALDGEPLDPMNGGPLRWVQPHYMYGYKGVKWLASITLQNEFTPGFWEDAVGDAHGYIPDGTLAMFEHPEFYESGEAA
jgi:hypothetical protein